MIRKLPAAEKLTMPGWRQFLPDFRLGLQNLVAHKLRTLLTMLGMIFGVAAVVSMLSIEPARSRRSWPSSSSWVYET
jgi:hypothetical protein